MDSELSKDGQWSDQERCREAHRRSEGRRKDLRPEGHRCPPTDHEVDYFGRRERIKSGWPQTEIPKDDHWHQEHEEVGIFSRKPPMMIYASLCGPEHFDYDGFIR